MKFFYSVSFLFFIIFYFAGCSTQKEITKDVPTVINNRDLERAKLKIIDGSIYDIKSEYANAILEYQEALKYHKSPEIYYLLAKDFALLGKVPYAIENIRISIGMEPNNVTYRELLAEIFFNTFEIDSAIEQYEKIIKIDSSNEQAVYNLALLYKKSKPLTAIRLLTRLIDDNGPRFDILLHLIEIYSVLDKSSEELGAIEELAKIDPGNPRLKQLLAEYYLKSNKPEKAVGIYEELLETNPDDEISLKMLGDIYIRNNQIEKAQKIYENYLKANPNSYEIQGAMAFLYAKRKEWQKAKSLFISLLKNDSLRLEFKLDIASIYYVSGDSDKVALDDSKDFFTIITEKYPKDAHAFFYLSAIAVKHGNIKEVKLNFDKFIELSKIEKLKENIPFYATEIGRLFVAKEDFPNAIEFLERTKSIYGKELSLLYFLGFSYSRIGENDKSIELLAQALDQEPPKELKVDIVGQLGLIYEGIKNHIKSDSLYEIGLSLDPENHLILNNYSYSLSERGLQLDRSEKMSKKALDTEPENSSYLDTYGWILYKMGNYTNAEIYIKKAVGLRDATGGNGSVINDHLGDIYFKLGDKEKSMFYWRRALEMNPDNPELKEKIKKGGL